MYFFLICVDYSLINQRLIYIDSRSRPSDFQEVRNHGNLYMEEIAVPCGNVLIDDKDSLVILIWEITVASYIYIYIYRV